MHGGRGAEQVERRRLVASKGTDFCLPRQRGQELSLSLLGAPDDCVSRRFCLSTGAFHLHEGNAIHLLKLRLLRLLL